MGLVVIESEFKGQVALSQNDFSKLADFITDYERPYLDDLLGETEAQSFIDNLTNKVPTDAKYLTIFNKLSVTLPCGKKVISRGIKKMLLGFIYYEFIREDSVKHTITGQVRNANENSVPLIDAIGITKRYNASVNDFQIIQYYIDQNSTTYPEYAGVKKETALWF